MKFKNSEAKKKFEKGIAAQEKDAYGLRIFSYAKYWSEIMETEIKSGKKVSDCAKEASHLADTDGITGFMYGNAVSILAQCWEHGRDLQEWSNLDIQVGNEGERANKEGSTLNPALLCITKQ